jgi:hypothetical protein
VSRCRCPPQQQPTAQPPPPPLVCPAAPPPQAPPRSRRCRQTEGRPGGPLHVSIQHIVGIMGLQRKGSQRAFFHPQPTGPHPTAHRQPPASQPASHRTCAGCAAAAGSWAAGPPACASAAAACAARRWRPAPQSWRQSAAPGCRRAGAAGAEQAVRQSRGRRVAGEVRRVGSSRHSCFGVAADSRCPVQTGAGGRDGAALTAGGGP